MEDPDQLLQDHRMKLGRTKKKNTKILSTGLHGSQARGRVEAPHHSVPAAAAEDRPEDRQHDVRRRVDMVALRLAVQEQDAEVAGIERERIAMSDPAASTFANIDDVCVKMLLNGQQAQALDYLSRCARPPAPRAILCLQPGRRVASALTSADRPQAPGDDRADLHAAGPQAERAELGPERARRWRWRGWWRRRGRRGRWRAALTNPAAAGQPQGRGRRGTDRPGCERPAPDAPPAVSRGLCQEPACDRDRSRGGGRRRGGE